MHAAILRSSVAHGRIRSIDTSAALKRPGVHARHHRGRCWALMPIITMRQELLPEFKPLPAAGDRPATRCAMSASRSPWSWPTAPALAEDALEAIELDIEELPAVAGRGRRATNASLLFDDTGSNLRRHADRAARATPMRAFKDAPYVRRERFEVQRFTAVPMEPRGLLAEWDAAQAAHHGVRRRQGGVPQPPHAREAHGTRRRRRHHDRGRRRRRLRRARRILSGGFPDPVRGAAARPAGEMDRGSPRASDRDQSRARCRMRAGDRLRARRHDPRPARQRRGRSRRLYPHQRHHRGAQHRAGAVGAVPHSATSTSTCRCC